MADEDAIPNFDHLDDGDIEKALAQIGQGAEPDLPDAEEVAEHEPVAEPEPKPEPEPAEDPEAEPQVEVEEPAAAQEDGDEIPSEMDILRAEFQTLKTRTDNEAAARKRLEGELLAERTQRQHWQKVAGRHAGKLGFLERQRTEEPAEEIDEYPAEPPRPEPAPEPRLPERDADREFDNTEQLKQTVTAATQIPDYDELKEGIGEYLTTEESRSRIQEAVVYGTKRQVHMVTSAVMDEAIASARLKRDETRLQELKDRRASQIEKRKQAKVVAASPGSGSAPPTPPKAKTEDELSDEELEQAMLDVTGGNW